MGYQSSLAQLFGAWDCTGYLQKNLLGGKTRAIQFRGDGECVQTPSLGCVAAARLMKLFQGEGKCPLSL